MPTSPVPGQMHSDQQLCCSCHLISGCSELLVVCRSLVTQAAGMGGQPWLLSFSGMAQVMGWTHRPPLVAPCSRSAVLQSWQPHCRGHVPLQRCIPFHHVHSMSPADFVLALAADLQACLSRCSQPVLQPTCTFGIQACECVDAKLLSCPHRGLQDAVTGIREAACVRELASALSQQPEVLVQVSGIVVGEGYRFGYKAQGDTDMLAALCEKHHLKLHVATLLASSSEPETSVSSSKACPACRECQIRCTSACVPCHCWHRPLESGVSTAADMLCYCAGRPVGMGADVWSESASVLMELHATRGRLA